MSAPADRIHPQMRDAMQQDRALRAGLGSELMDQRRAGRAAADYWSVGEPPMADIEDRLIPGPAGEIALRIYRPGTEGIRPVIVLIHGGAFIVGSIDQADPVARGLAARTDAIVVSTSYRLAPEHPFPAGLEDCSAVLEWTARNAALFGGDADRLAVAGISAGANLAAAALLKTCVSARATLLVYGVFQTATDTPSHAEFGNGDFGLSTRRVEEGFLHYIPAGIDRNDPRISLLHADPTGLPPCLLQVAELDPLRDDSTLFAERLRAAGVPCELTIHQGMVHGFMNKGRLVDEANVALAQAGQFLRAHLK